jgi:hypothetical protein
MLYTFELKKKHVAGSKKTGNMLSEVKIKETCCRKQRNRKHVIGEIKAETDRYV